MRIISSLPFWLGRRRAAALGWSCTALLVGGLLAGSARAHQATTAPRAVLLVAARADAPRQSQRRGVFEQRTLTITLESAQIRLASTPDGVGALCTDDRAMLTLTAGDGATQRWTYDFASPDRRAITCQPPQALALPVGAGVYTVTITLEDLYPDTYGTRAYYLVVDAAGELVAAPDRQPAARLADPTPALTHAAQPAAQPIATPAVATAALSPVPSVVPVTVRRTDPGGIGAQIIDMHVLVVLGAALALAILALMRWRSVRRRLPPAPQLRGVLYLFEPATREARTIALPGSAAGMEIYRRPLTAVPIGATGGTGAAIARIQATAHGPVLLEGDVLNAQPVELERDRPYSLADGSVTLRYRDQGAGLRRSGARSGHTAGRGSITR